MPLELERLSLRYTYGAFWRAVQVLGDEKATALTISTLTLGTLADWLWLGLLSSLPAITREEVVFAIDAYVDRGGTLLDLVDEISKALTDSPFIKAMERNHQPTPSPPSPRFDDSSSATPTSPSASSG